MEEKLNIKTPEDWRRIYLQRFKDLHDNFSDEIPTEMIDVKKEGGYKYKARGNWFSAVSQNLRNAELQNLFPDSFNQKYKKFFETYGKKMSGTWKTVRTTKEDIDTANSLLKEAQEIISKL